MAQQKFTRELTQADMAQLVELGLIEPPKVVKAESKKLTLAILKGLQDGNFVANQTAFAVRCSGLKTTTNPNRPYTLKEYTDKPWQFVATSWLSALLPKGSRAIAPKGLWDIRISGLKTTFLVHYSEVQVQSKK